VTTLEFIADVIGAIAWPVVVLVIVFVLRRSIVTLLGRDGLRRLKAGPVEAEWERQLGRVEGDVARLPRDTVPGRPSSVPVVPVFTEELVELATSDPVAAIERAYAGIRGAIGAVLEYNGKEVVPTAGALELARIAHAGGILSDATVRAVEGAVVLRNLAASRISGTEAGRALEFLPIADAIIYSTIHDAERASRRSESEPPVGPMAEGQRSGAS
jgi:hypothetical protein